MSDLPQTVMFGIESPPLQDEFLDEYVFDIIPLVYNDNTDTTAITNVLLIDNTVQEYQQFVDGCNANTFPIVYDYHSDRNELKSLLTRKFSNIQRIAFVFHNAGMNGKLFLNNQCFFEGSDLETPENFSENFQVLLDIIRDFQVVHLDYLACNSLEYDNWKQYYELLKTTANVVIGASNDATGNLKYGGDWVMENTNHDIKTIYFNESIDEYTKTLATNKTISGNLSSGNNIYVKQLTTAGNNIYWSTSDNSANDINTGSWTQINTTVDWQVTLNNTNAAPDASNRLVVTFFTDITVSNIDNYFIIGSDYVTVDGGNKMVDVSGVINYPGLIRNGIFGANGKSNITVTNINTKITGTTSLATSAGYICQSFFCTGSSGINTISNCTNNGNILGQSAGGIVGSNFAYNSTIDIINTISNCTNNGNITNSNSGGIAGSNFASSSAGTNTINNCTNNRIISGENAGGIAGLSFALSSSGTNKIINCSNTGKISGQFAGGIAGRQFARLATKENTIEKCSNSGDISGNYVGGIAGLSFAASSSGTNKIIDCTNNGNILSLYAGGIAGAQFAQSTTSTSINTIEKCSNIGDISGNYAGGIAGLSFAVSSSGTNKITDCSNNGNILSLYAGGIAGSYFASTSSGTNKIIDCTNNGIISGNSAGGISGKFTGYNSSGTNTITNCVNNGDISGNFTGGISGGAIAYTNASNIRPTVIISNSYSVGIIRNTTDSGGICAGFDGKDLDDDDNLIDASYATTATAIITNCYSLYGNIKAPTQSIRVTFNITNTYEANGLWSSPYALRNLLLKDASNVYIWAYKKLNGIDQTDSAYLLRSLNTSNTYVSEIIPTITFSVTSPKTFGLDASFTLTEPSSNSPSDFSYNSSNASVATISNRKVTIVGSGLTTITVRQDACGNFLDGSANVLLTVNSQIPPIINFIIPKKIYGDFPFRVGASSTNTTAPFTYSIQANNVATISGDIVTILNAGTAIITASQPQMNGFTDGSANAMLTVNTETTSTVDYSSIVPLKTYTVTIGESVLIKPRKHNITDSNYSWNITPSLPAGLRFSKRTGKIRGTPVSTMDPRTYAIRLTIRDATTDIETYVKRIILAII